MNVVLIGGMDRLERHYVEEAENCGVRLKVFTKSETGISSKLGSAEAMILFTNKVSHRVRNEALNMAKARNIPVHMCHSCGVCSLRTCLLNCLKPQ